MRPTNAAIVFAFRQFQRLRDALGPEVPIVIVAGNHDTPRSSETGSILRLFEELGISVAIDEARRFDFPALDLSVLAVPHPALLDPDPPEIRPSGPAKYHVLAIHAEAPDLLPAGRPSLEYGGVIVTPEQIGSGSWNYVAWGHYHVRHQVTGKEWYSGALEYTSTNIWGERAEEEANGIDAKSWLMVDVATGEVTPHLVKHARRVIDLPPLYADGLGAPELDAAIADRVASVPDGIAQQIVRLVVFDVPRHRGAGARTTRRSAPGRPPRCTSTWTCGGRCAHRTTGVGAPGRRQTLPEVVRDWLSDRVAARRDRSRAIRGAWRGAGGAGRDRWRGRRMIIHRLRLVNFRQHENTEIEFGNGLTGIIGPNGAGKTTLLEAIAWAMYGMPAARGTRESIKRRGAPPRAGVEVELAFSLGAHRYRVVRKMGGAELYLDASDAPIATGIGPVTDRVTRLMGMRRDEFFNTYFTGQKELAVMSAMKPTERAQFLSRVLGYERLRVGQDRLRNEKTGPAGATRYAAERLAGSRGPAGSGGSSPPAAVRRQRSSSPRHANGCGPPIAATRSSGRSGPRRRNSARRPRHSIPNSGWPSATWKRRAGRPRGWCPSCRRPTAAVGARHSSSGRAHAAPGAARGSGIA